MARLPPYTGSGAFVNRMHSSVTVKSAKTGATKRVEVTYPSSGKAVVGKKTREPSRYYCRKSVLNKGKCKLMVSTCQKCKRFDDLRW